MKLTTALKEVVQERLEETRSSEQIIGRQYTGKLSIKNIFRWIYDGLLEVTLTVFCQKGNDKGLGEQQSASIVDRSFRND